MRFRSVAFLCSFLACLSLYRSGAVVANTASVHDPVNLPPPGILEATVTLVGPPTDEDTRVRHGDATRRSVVSADAAPVRGQPSSPKLTEQPRIRGTIRTPHIPAATAQEVRHIQDFGSASVRSASASLVSRQMNALVARDLRGEDGEKELADYQLDEDFDDDEFDEELDDDELDDDELDDDDVTEFIEDPPKPVARRSYDDVDDDDAPPEGLSSKGKWLTADEDDKDGVAANGGDAEAEGKGNLSGEAKPETPSRVPIIAGMTGGVGLVAAAGGLYYVQRRLNRVPNFEGKFTGD